MTSSSTTSRPGPLPRAVVALALLGAVVAWWFLVRRPTTPGEAAPSGPHPGLTAADPDAPVQPPSPVRTVALQFLVATVPSGAGRRPDVARLLQSIDAAPGAQAGAEPFNAWLGQIQSLAGAGVITIESRPTLVVRSGQTATIGVSSQTAAGSESLSITATPELGESDAVALDIRCRAGRAENAVERWTQDSSFPLGPHTDLARQTVVLPGGGAALLGAVRTPLGREGTLIVMVTPEALASTPGPSPQVAD
ncbi:MAG: hypothetical protein IPJ41_07635 [Phycisphaerales bacterium]|nr:hypothetical protein [Phycisphaerales bacterium]